MSVKYAVRALATAERSPFLLASLPFSRALLVEYKIALARTAIIPTTTRISMRVKAGLVRGSWLVVRGLLNFFLRL